jgi:hypothetical protein
VNVFRLGLVVGVVSVWVYLWLLEPWFALVFTFVLCLCLSAYDDYEGTKKSIWSFLASLALIPLFLMGLFYWIKDGDL